LVQEAIVSRLVQRVIRTGSIPLLFPGSHPFINWNLQPFINSTDEYQLNFPVQVIISQTMNWFMSTKISFHTPLLSGGTS